MSQHHATCSACPSETLSRAVQRSCMSVCVQLCLMADKLDLASTYKEKARLGHAFADCKLDLSKFTGIVSMSAEGTKSSRLPNRQECHIVRSCKAAVAALAHFGETCLILCCCRCMRRCQSRLSLLFPVFPQSLIPAHGIALVPAIYQNSLHG